VEPSLIEDLSAVPLRDFEERKSAMLLRMISRTLLREAGIVQSGRLGERAGGAFVARVAARSLAHAAERADTRSWSGLPAELLVARLRLPPGTHELKVTFQGPSGPDSRYVVVEVEAGSVSVESVAVYGRDGGDQRRFVGATRGVTDQAPQRRAARGR
jgi:hypothetical protein